MYNFVSVEFPNASVPPSRVHSFELRQERYKHEFGTIQFRDWDVDYDNIRPGTPVLITLTGQNGKQDISCYVHHIEPHVTPGKKFVEVHVIGASYFLKKTSQQVYVNQTASEIVTTIAKRNGFAYDVDSHPRVYPQVSQAGLTDMEMMVKLAKQCGYLLRVSNTEVYFHSMTKSYEEFRENAPVFYMRDTSSPDGSTLYSFEPLVGESLEFEDGEYKAATAVAGVDRFTGKIIKVTNQKRPKATKKRSEPDFFDRFASSVVVNDYSVADNESKSVDQRNIFPYRAKAEILGESSVYPGMPVYLDGVGNTYAGFWIVLKARHKIVSNAYNSYIYTTIITVGTDSLGTAVAGKDNKLVEVPSTKAKRNIVKNVRQTNRKPESKLKKGSPFPSKQAQVGFGETKNRIRTRVANKEVVAKKWVNTAGNLRKVQAVSSRPQTVVKKLRRDGVL
jgi:hypothetical protein